MAPFARRAACERATTHRIVRVGRATVDSTHESSPTSIGSAIGVREVGTPGTGEPESAGGAAGRSGRRAARPTTCSFPRPVDLGGIGKGLTLRWAPLASSWHRSRRFLLEAGGDLVARGYEPDGDRWLVGIEDPGSSDDLAVVTLVEEAIATSSSRVNRWVVDGRTVHRLVDPSDRKAGRQRAGRGDG